MKLHLILARARNGVIGKNGQMPWHLPEDLAHFKRTTLNHPVIMGRKTWDSLPEAVRPLPGRLNIVITRQKGWQATGAMVAHSLPDAIRLCPQNGIAWVMGGAEIYAQALPLASTAVITEIDTEVEGDAMAPTLGPEWQELKREAHTAANGLHYQIVTYRKRDEQTHP